MYFSPSGFFQNILSLVFCTLKIKCLGKYCWPLYSWYSLCLLDLWFGVLLKRHRDTGLIPGFARSTVEVNRNPLQYSCLGNSMDRRGWQATVSGVSKSWTKLSIHTHTINWGKLFSLSCFKDFFCSFLCFFYFFYSHYEHTIPFIVVS